jgi:drug/metabolite transporter (DMT)-like permease
MRAERLGLALVLLSTVAWSTAGYFTRLIALESWTLLFWRGVFGALTAAAFVLIRERRGFARAFLAMDRDALLFTLTAGIGMTAYLWALRLTSVAHVAIIFATVPFMAAALAALVLRERTTALTLLASLLAFVGVTVIMFDGPAGGGLAGDLVAVVMTALTAVMIVQARRRPGIPMIEAGCLSAVLAALLAAPYARIWPVPTDQLALLAFFGATNMGFGLILFTYGSTLIPAAESALISSLEAPLAPFWVWLAFGETPLMSTIVGGALVMAAVLAHVVLAARRPAHAG